MSDFVMPSLGADMEAGKLVEWLVAPGDHISRGDIIAVVETQKGAIEVEVFEDGVVEDLVVGEGEEVPVGTVLAHLAGAEEKVAKAAKPAAPPAPPPNVPKRTPAPTPSAGEPRPGAHIRASPAARARAVALGLSLAGLAGTGPGGAISIRDVEAAAASAGNAKPGALGPRKVKPGFDPAEMRRAIAAAMARSKREIPHYYLARRVEVSRLMAWLEAENARRPIQERLLSIVPLVKAAALALREVPVLNGFYRDGGFSPAAERHIGVAIALRGGGLAAPAIHNVDALDLDRLMSTLRDLTSRVRTGRLRSSEMMDPTITLTSLGEDSAEIVYPVIYPPQVAAIGLGSVRARPWAVDGALAVRPVIDVTLAADHRVSDGRDGGQFLVLYDRLLQEPETL